MEQIWNKIKQGFSYVGGVLIEVFTPVAFVLRTVLGYIPTIVKFTLPYQMIALVLSGAPLYLLVLWPVIMFLIIGILQVLANRANVGKRVPMPKKRFTQIDDDGEVSIPVDRTEELILYMADLEEWMVRKGWL